MDAVTNIPNQVINSGEHALSCGIFGNFDEKTITNKE